MISGDTYHRMIHARRALRPYSLLVPGAAVIFTMVAVTLFLLRFSFNVWHPSEGMTTAWTVQQYVTFFSESYYLDALLRTLRIALTVTVINLVLGYVVAYVMASSPRYRNAILLCVVAPLIIDVVVRVYGWIVLLSINGLVNRAAVGLGVLDRPTKLVATEGAVIAELIHETIAFMILPIAAVLQKMDPSLREASSTLSANRWQTFLHVTLPLSLPGVFVGTLLVFALNISAFTGPLLLGGGRVEVMSLIIKNQLGVTLNWPLGSSMAIVLVALTLVILFAYGRAMRSYQHPLGRRP